MISIGSIKWPSNKRRAAGMLRTFMSGIAESHIAFDRNPCPVTLANQLVNDNLSEELRVAELVWWWSKLEEEGHTRGPACKTSALCRIAICLLSELSDASLGEVLSWFIEVLYAYDPQVQDIAIDEAHLFFEFESPL